MLQSVTTYRELESIANLWSLISNPVLCLVTAYGDKQYPKRSKIDL
ncbi:hypothetical protein QE357_004954 [Siphonobacter sp. BAB-5404]|nr:hypothetical protein [Siphonobacter sp. SORGH_AS_1065]MDR6197842.1 hypothetical protein [Siphonobacter sp. SORGH_AS_0500]